LAGGEVLNKIFLVEVIKVRVLHGFFDVNSFGWVECNHLCDEVEAKLIHVPEEGLGRGGPEAGECGFEVRQVNDSRPIVDGGSPMVLEDSKDLIDLAVALEEAALLDHLGKNTSNGPHVNAKGVLFLGKKDLWSSVPESFDFMS
jgi:hypothetical protein